MLNGKLGLRYFLVNDLIIIENDFHMITLAVNIADFYWKFFCGILGVYYSVQHFLGSDKLQ